MKMSFHKKPVIDFVLRLTLTIIIISPVIYFSGMPSKGRREVIMSKVWSLFLWLGLPCLYVICFSQSRESYKCKEKQR